MSSPPTIIASPTRTNSSTAFPTTLLTYIKTYPPPLPQITTLLTFHYTPLKSDPKPELALSALLSILGPTLTHSPSSEGDGDDILAQGSNSSHVIISENKISSHIISSSIRSTSLLAFNIALKILGVEKLPQNFIDILSKFLEQRVLDPSSIIGCLNITYTIVSTLNAYNLVKKVIKNIDVTGLNRVDRSLCFNIIGAVDGPEVVCMIIDFLLGEKDPRCLLLALKTLNRKLEGQKEERGGWEDEVLEAVQVYYPITFEPPPGDRRGVSNESLRRELNECLRKVGGVKVCLERCEEEVSWF